MMIVELEAKATKLARAVQYSKQLPDVLLLKCGRLAGQVNQHRLCRLEG